MARLRRQPLLALGAFLGTVIGVGIFALPYAAAQTGMLPLVLGFVVLTVIVIIIHERFTHLVAAFPERRHRIPGYIGLVLGGRVGRWSLGASVLSLLGAAVAYIILGATFLQLAFSSIAPLSLTVCASIFVLAGVLLVARGERFVSKVDLLFLAAVVVITIIMTLIAAGSFNPDHLARVHWPSLPMMYGLILFSLWGLAVVPETVDLAEGRRTALHIIRRGLVATTVLYVLFTGSILGVSGSATTQDAITGFLGVAGNGLAVPFALFGVFTTFTSYVTLLLTLTQTLRFDLRLASRGAFATALLAPYALFLLGLRNVLEVLGVTGAVFLGAEGSFVLWATDVVRRGRRRLHWSTQLLLSILLLGVVAELWSFLRTH